MVERAGALPGEQLLKVPSKPVLCSVWTHSICSISAILVEELCDGLKAAVFHKHDVDPILRILIYMATANQPIT
jgi:hypothetical protein